MNILFSTFELAPFTKVGGLADVVSDKRCVLLLCALRFHFLDGGGKQVQEQGDFFRTGVTFYADADRRSGKDSVAQADVVAVVHCGCHGFIKLECYTFSSRL